MTDGTSTTFSFPAARLAIGASAAALLCLALLHTLSPEFDPAWRMVSEYANGNHGWVLSLMFAAWGIGSWALAFMLRSEVKNTDGKIGLIFLVLAGVGEAMASIFDIKHPLHDLAGFIGIGCLPIAAMLISVSLSRTVEWSNARKTLLWTANLTWISVVLLIATFVIMVATFMQSGAVINPEMEVTVLPQGVIGLVGWTNRFLIIAYCVWVITVASQALKHDNRNSRVISP